MPTFNLNDEQARDLVQSVAQALAGATGAERERLRRLRDQLLDQMRVRVEVITDRTAPAAPAPAPPARRGVRSDLEHLAEDAADVLDLLGKVVKD